MENNLYLVTFKQDNTANFYEEIAPGILKLLFKSKTLDTGKIMESCSSFFNAGRLDCDTRIKINEIPEKIAVKKIFPSNIEGRNQFYALLEEHQMNSLPPSPTSIYPENTKIRNDNIYELVRNYTTNKDELPDDLKDIPIGNWDVSQVTNMMKLFQNNTMFNEPLNKWNVSNVTNMYGMFQGCTNFNQPLNDWNVGNVRIMADMFRDCTNFNQPLNDWNVSNVKEMNSMFQGCINFNQPLNHWNVSNVRNMTNMFRDCRSFNRPLNDWNVEQVERFNDIFINCPIEEANKPRFRIVIPPPQPIQRFSDYPLSNEPIQPVAADQPNSICDICTKEINDINNCVVCENGHKFHFQCPDYTQQHWVFNQKGCPTCRSRRIYRCRNTFSKFSGGKRRTRKASRKPRRKSVKKPKRKHNHKSTKK